MKTMDQRIEAAAQRYCDVSNISRPKDAARLILRAAFPELFSDPPQAWLAPVDLLEWGISTDKVREFLEAGRAHLKSQGGEP